MGMEWLCAGFQAFTGLEIHRKRSNLFKCRAAQSFSVDSRQQKSRFSMEDIQPATKRSFNADEVSSQNLPRTDDLSAFVNASRHFFMNCAKMKA